MEKSKDSIAMGVYITALRAAKQARAQGNADADKLEEKAMKAWDAYKQALIEMKNEMKQELTVVEDVPVEMAEAMIETVVQEKPKATKKSTKKKVK